MAHHDSFSQVTIKDVDYEKKRNKKMHTQRRYATCSKGMLEKKDKKRKMHTQRWYAACPQGMSKRKKKRKIVHILDGHFREKESWYVMEFYFMGG